MDKQMKDQSLTFWTTGEHLTKIMRDLWEERSCIHAFKTAKEGLGMNEEQAISLFEGRMKLGGDTRNDPNLYSETDNYKGITTDEMMDWFEKKYIELRTDKLKYDLTLRNNMIKYLGLGRGVGILDTQTEAKNAALSMEKKTFEYLRNLMFLYNISNRSITDFENKVEEALRNAEFSKDASYIKDDLDAQNAKTLFDASIRKLNESIAAGPRTTDEFIENETKIDSLGATKGKPKDSSSGWLSPDGDFYPCPYMGHIVLMEALAEEGIVENVTQENDLERQNWVKISSFRMYNLDGDFSNRQKDFIFDFITAHDLDKIEINHHVVKSENVFSYLDEQVKSV